MNVLNKIWPWKRFEAYEIEIKQLKASLKAEESRHQSVKEELDKRHQHIRKMANIIALKGGITILMLSCLTCFGQSWIRNNLDTNSVGSAPADGWFLLSTNSIPAWGINGRAFTNLTLTMATNSDLFTSNLLWTMISSVTNTTITINGTANQITSSSGAQPLNANRTWTLSTPTGPLWTNVTSSGNSSNTNGYSNYQGTDLVASNANGSATFVGGKATFTGGSIFITPTNTPSSGQVITASSTAGDSAWQTISNAGPTMPTVRQTASFFDDFEGGISTSVATGPLRMIVNANSGQIQDIAGEATAPGIYRISTLTGTTAAPVLNNASQDFPLILSSMTVTNEWRWRCAQLPGAGGNINTYTNRIGFCNSINGADGSHAMYFRVSTNDSHFVYVCRKASAETNIVSTTTVTANQWYRLRIVATPTTATFTIDDADSATITNQIPTAQMAVMAMTVKQVGGTAVTADVDYVYLAYSLNTSR